MDSILKYLKKYCEENNHKYLMLFDAKDKIGKDYIYYNYYEDKIISLDSDLISEHNKNFKFWFWVQVNEPRNPHYFKELVLNDTNIIKIDTLIKQLQKRKEKKVNKSKDILKKYGDLI